jgi:uncharacterized DUF497 family protein
MDFEWDEDKRQANIRKHGIDFVDVPAVFDGYTYEEISFLKQITDRLGATRRTRRRRH